jgi:hypothetical protein
MGIAYFQAAVKNIYTTSQTDVNNTIQGEVASDGNNPRSAEYYEQRAATVMKDRIQTGLNSIPSEKQISPNASFKLIYKNFDNNIILKVQGIENGKSTTLTTEMILSTKVSGLSESTGSTPLISISLTGVITGFDSILKPLVLDNFCKTPSSLNVYNICKKVTISGNRTYNENNINGGTIADPYIIYANSNLKIAGNANNLSNVQLHTDGSISFGKNMNNTSNVLLEIKNTTSDNPAANFDSQLRLDSSQLYVNGNLKVDGQFDLINNSYVLVNGNANVSKNLNILSGSKLCVDGNLTVNKLGKIYGYLIVNGSINGKPTTISDQDFQQRCGTSTTHTATIEWGNQLENIVNYEY